MIDEIKTYEENYSNYDFMRARLIEADGILVLFDSVCNDLSDTWIHALVRDLHVVEHYANTCIFSP